MEANSGYQSLIRLFGRTGHVHGCSAVKQNGILAICRLNNKPNTRRSQQKANQQKSSYSNVQISNPDRGTSAVQPNSRQMRPPCGMGKHDLGAKTGVARHGVPEQSKVCAILLCFICNQFARYFPWRLISMPKVKAIAYVSICIVHQPDVYSYSGATS